MSDLEKRFKHAGGEQLLTGAVPVALQPNEAETISMWIVKTAQMLRDAFAYKTGDIRIPASHHSSLHGFRSSLASLSRRYIIASHLLWRYASFPST